MYNANDTHQKIIGYILWIFGFTAYSGETGPPIPVQSGPPVGAKRRWSLFLNRLSTLVK